MSVRLLKVKIYDSDQNENRFAKCKYVVYTQMKNNPSNPIIKNKLYVHNKKNLIVSGGHSILVDELTDGQRQATSEYFVDTPKIQDKYFLLCLLK